MKKLFLFLSLISVYAFSQATEGEQQALLDNEEEVVSDHVRICNCHSARNLEAGTRAVREIPYSIDRMRHAMTMTICFTGLGIMGIMLLLKILDIVYG